MKRNNVLVLSIAFGAIALVIGVLVGTRGQEVESQQSVGLELVADGFVSPVGLIASSDETGRMFVVDQVGIIRVMTADGRVLEEPFLDLRSRMVRLNADYDERGLLGLAFHPAFATNGRLFVYYSAPLRSEGPQNWDHTSHISEFRLSLTDSDKADSESERIILEVDEPQANHNAGQITFGPDGYLYVALGDGGRANDTGTGHPPMGNGQDISTLLGSILRIDVDGAEPYGIPPDNPFVGKDGRDEIFAYGLRNPFRISFDIGGNHELFVGDVGQQLWEEVNIVTRGNNFGWNIKEGVECFDPSNARQPAKKCPDVGISGDLLLDPIIAYRNSRNNGAGTAVIGGFVYRGNALPRLQGAYIFGDFTVSRPAPDGRLFIATRPSAPGAKWLFEELAVNTTENGRINAFLRSFGQDVSGELYVLTANVPGPAGNTGKIFKIVP